MRGEAAGEQQRRSNPDQGVRTAAGVGEGGAGGEIPLDTNSIKPPPARRTRSLSGSGGLLAVMSENSGSRRVFATALPILRGKFNLPDRAARYMAASPR